MMQMGSQDISSLTFSTRDMPPARRLPALRDLFDRSVSLEIDTDPGHVVEMSMQIMPGLRRAQMLSPLTAHMGRPARMLADGEDTVCLMMKTGGHMSLTQRRHQGVPQLGDGVLLVYREAAALEFVDTTYVSVRVPLVALAMRSGAVEDAAARCIPCDTEALSLLKAYLTSLPERIANPQLSQLSARHVYDLIALSIGTTGDRRELARQGGVRAARLEAAKTELVRNSSLDLGQLAARQGVSPRYVQMLFEEAGTTYSEFVLERRLDAARAMLTSPRFSQWSITSIALEVGFGDLSHFNRSFKRRYLMTPTDMRRSMMNGKTRPVDFT